MAEHEEGGVARLRRKVQPTQGTGRWPGGPVQQGAATAVLQDAFGGPQGIGSLTGIDPQQLAGGKTMRQPGLRAGRVRRMQQHDAAPGGQLPQGGQEQPHFAQTGLCQQQFGQTAQGPASAGQVAGQVGMAGFQARTVGARELRAAPKERVDGGMGRGGRDSEGGHEPANMNDYCINIQYLREVAAASLSFGMPCPGSGIVAWPSCCCNP